MLQLLAPISHPQTSHVLAALDYHLRHRGGPALGIGPDPFSATPIAHPTALALYAHGLVDLHRATGDGHYADAALHAIERLVAAGRRHGHGLAWGLEFPWLDADETQPFAVTTAIAVRALAACDIQLGHRASRPALSQGARWLHETLPWTTGADTAPTYSPSMPYPVVNVASMVASALFRAGRALGRPQLVDAADLAAGFVLRHQDPLTGLWRYGAVGEELHGNVRRADVIDAIHTGYALEGMLDALELHDDRGYGPAVRRAGLSIASELVGPHGRLREKVVVARHDDPEASTLLANPRISAKSIDDETFLVVFPEESRAAGYGALIGPLARGVADGLISEQLLARLVGRTLAIHAADASGRFLYRADDRAAYPRQEAHIFAGLAAYAASHPTGHRETYSNGRLR
jgi:hypothetical protein